MSITWDMPLYGENSAMPTQQNIFYSDIRMFSIFTIMPESPKEVRCDGDFTTFVNPEPPNSELYSCSRGDTNVGCFPWQKTRKR